MSKQTTDLSLPKLTFNDGNPTTKEELQRTLFAAIKEGEAEEATPLWWAALRQEIADSSPKRKPIKE